MTFGSALEILAREFQSFELRLQGLFNVDCGGFSIANDFYEPCDCPFGNFGNAPCQECSRGKNQSSVTFPSRDGDGIHFDFATVLPGQRPGEKDETARLRMTI